MTTVLCAIGITVLCWLLLAVLGACKLSGDISEWEERDGK